MTSLWLAGALIAATAVLGIPALRRTLFSGYLIRQIAGVLPQLGSTECVALETGTAWWEGELFDPASVAAPEKHDEAFGQKLAIRGVHDGPFVTLPILGPSSLRDASTLPLDLLADPMVHYRNTSVRNKVWAMRLVHARACLLPAESLSEDTNDLYATIRESWLQNRNYKKLDDKPPELAEVLLDEFVDE